MNSIKVFSKALLICACTVAVAGVLHAETVSQVGNVTVIRGVDDAATAAQRRASRGRSGVVIFRGESIAAETPARPAVRDAMPMPQMVGGQNVWLRDPETGSISACSLRYDYYGNRNVRCSQEYP